LTGSAVALRIARNVYRNTGTPVHRLDRCAEWMGDSCGTSGWRKNRRGPQTEELEALYQMIAAPENNGVFVLAAPGTSAMIAERCRPQPSERENRHSPSREVRESVSDILRCDGLQECTDNLTTWMAN
jgi:hypothetical protein